jgi:hypothetical protein
VNLSKTNDAGVAVHATCTTSTLPSNYTLKTRRNAVYVTLNYVSDTNN